VLVALSDEPAHPVIVVGDKKQTTRKRKRRGNRGGTVANTSGSFAC
jgi:hypothetical protein